MKSHSLWWTVPPAIIAYASSAYAAHYFSVQEVQKLFFPEAETFVVVDLSSKERKSFRNISGNNFVEPEVWKARKGPVNLGFVVVDEVIGKHDLITYAVALSTAGTVHQIEILEYRETQGGEISEQQWRDQFKGKTYADALEIGHDIENISGATISCQHITQGVKRIISLFHNGVFRNGVLDDQG